MNKIVFFFLLASFSFGQNIELNLSLIEEGKVEGVKENLPELSSKYPNNPGVLYLERGVVVNKYHIRNLDKIKLN